MKSNFFAKVTADVGFSPLKPDTALSLAQTAATGDGCAAYLSSLLKKSHPENKAASNDCLP